MLGSEVGFDNFFERFAQMLFKFPRQILITKS